MDPVSWLEHAAEGDPIVLFLVIVIAMFLDSLSLVGSMLPGDLLLLIPSAAVGPSGALVVIAGSVTGTVLGYTVSYAVGARAGDAIRHSWPGRRVGQRRWDQAERLLRGPAGRTLALVQFMPVLNYLIPMLAGTLRVPLKRFVQLTGTGAVAYASFYVSLGSLAGGTGEAIGQSTGQFIAVIVVSGTAALFGVTVLARAVHRLAEADSAAEDDATQDTGHHATEDGATEGDQQAARDQARDHPEVDADPDGVAHSLPCSPTSFSTGTGHRCP